MCRIWSEKRNKIQVRFQCCKTFFSCFKIPQPSKTWIPVCESLNLFRARNILLVYDAKMSNWQTLRGFGACNVHKHSLGYIRLWEYQETWMLYMIIRQLRDFFKELFITTAFTPTIKRGRKCRWAWSSFFTEFLVLGMYVQCQWLNKRKISTYHSTLTILRMYKLTVYTQFSSENHGKNERVFTVFFKQT